MANIGHLIIWEVEAERLHWDIHFARGSGLGARPSSQKGPSHKDILEQGGVGVAVADCSGWLGGAWGQG